MYLLTLCQAPGTCPFSLSFFLSLFSFLCGNCTQGLCTELHLPHFFLLLGLKLSLTNSVSFPAVFEFVILLSQTLRVLRMSCMGPGTNSRIQGHICEFKFIAFIIHCDNVHYLRLQAYLEKRTNWGVLFSHYCRTDHF